MILIKKVYILIYNILIGTDAGKIKIPESLGIVPATIYLAFNILGLIFT